MAGVSYKQYDPNNPTPPQMRIAAQLSRITKRDSPIIIRGFDSFTFAVHSGFKKITYQAQLRDDGLYFWVNEEHAKQIGLALRPTLEFLCIEVQLNETRALGCVNFVFCILTLKVECYSLSVLFLGDHI